MQTLQQQQKRIGYLAVMAFAFRLHQIKASHGSIVAANFIEADAGENVAQHAATAKEENQDDNDNDDNATRFGSTELVAGQSPLLLLF